jgi:hypothetical protein
MRGEPLAALLLFGAGITGSPRAASPVSLISRCSPVAPPRDTAHFVGLAGRRRQIGDLKVWTSAQGHVEYAESWQSDTIRYEWIGEIAIDVNGFPTRFVATRTVNGAVRNNETVEASGDSVFTTRNGRLSSRAAVAGVVALPALRAVPVLVLLTKCARTQPGDSLRTEQLGVLRAKVVGESDVSPGRGVSRSHLTLVELSSDSATKISRFWFDEQGRFVATADADGQADVLVAKHWIGATDQLLLAEANAATVGMRATASAVATPVPKGVAFVHARVLDPSTGMARAGMTVFVRGDTIRAVRPDSTFALPVGALVVDASRQTLAPGIWDLGQGFAKGIGSATGDDASRRLVSEGITSAQILTSDTFFTPLIASRIASGAQIGPRVYGTCFMDGWYPDRVGHAVPPRLGQEGQVRDSADVRFALARCTRLGWRVATFYPLLPGSLAKYAAKEAHRRGMFVTGDALVGMLPSELLALGYDQFGHVGQALMPFVQASDRDRDAWALGRIGGGITFVAKGWELARLDLTDPAIQDAVREMARRRTIVQSSLCVYELIGRRGDSTTSAAAMKKLLDFTAALHSAGVPMVIGTDGACTMVHEMTILHDLGFTNAELLRMATVDAARAVGRNSTAATIAAGSPADLILVDGDPLTDLSALQRITTVVAGGRLYLDPSALRKSLPFARR